MDLNTLLEKHRALCLEADEQVKKLERSLASFINCKPGCYSCCSLSSVLPLEAETIKRAVDCLNQKQQVIIRQQAAAVSAPYCPLLFEGICLIYEHRPLICRTHGVPVAYIDYELQTIEVSACLTNFPQDFGLDESQILHMDQLNEKLHRLNDYLPFTEKAARLSIGDIILRLS